MEIVDLLRKSPHFASLSAIDLDGLASAFIVSTLPADAVIFSAGDRGDALYLVVDGEVLVQNRERKRVHILRRVVAGELFGLRAVIDKQPRSASCVTAAPTTLGTLPAQAVTMLINRSAPVAYAFQKALAIQLARDLRSADVRLRDLIQQLDGLGAPR